MSQELIYTSAQRGLKSGSHGYCTVAATPGMPVNLAERLEALSGYRHLFPPADPQAHLNPVVRSFVRMNLGGRTYFVLSRVSDAGLDYSQRNNKLAHHVALDPNELPPAGPAWVLAQADYFQTEWSGEPRMLPPGRHPPKENVAATVCRSWEQLTGDAGWGGVLAETVQAPKRAAVFLIVKPGTDPLPLILESQRLLAPQVRWAATFSTFFTKLPPGVDCQWRCVLAGTPEARSVRSMPDALVIDLTQPLGAAEGGPLVAAARTGRVEAPAVAAAAATGTDTLVDKRRRAKVAPSRSPDDYTMALDDAPPAGPGLPFVHTSRVGVRSQPAKAQRRWIATVAALALLAGVLLGVSLERFVIARPSSAPTALAAGEPPVVEEKVVARPAAVTSPQPKTEATKPVEESPGASDNTEKTRANSNSVGPEAHDAPEQGPVNAAANLEKSGNAAQELFGDVGDPSSDGDSKAPTKPTGPIQDLEVDEEQLGSGKDSQSLVTTVRSDPVNVVRPANAGPGQAPASLTLRDQISDDVLKVQLITSPEYTTRSGAVYAIDNSTIRARTGTLNTARDVARVERSGSELLMRWDKPQSEDYEALRDCLLTVLEGNVVQHVIALRTPAPSPKLILDAESESTTLRFRNDTQHPLRIRLLNTTLDQRVQDGATSINTGLDHIVFNFSFERDSVVVEHYAVDPKNPATRRSKKRLESIYEGAVRDVNDATAKRDNRRNGLINLTGDALVNAKKDLEVKEAKLLSAEQHRDDAKTLLDAFNATWGSGQFDFQIYFVLDDIEVDVVRSDLTAQAF